MDAKTRAMALQLIPGGKLYTAWRGEAASVLIHSTQGYVMIVSPLGSLHQASTIPHMTSAAILRSCMNATEELVLFSDVHKADRGLHVHAPPETITIGVACKDQGLTEAPGC